MCRCVNSGFWLGLRTCGRRSLRRFLAVLVVIGRPGLYRRRRVLEVVYRHCLAILTSVRSSIGVVSQGRSDLGLSWTPSGPSLCLAMMPLTVLAGIPMASLKLGEVIPVLCIPITCHRWAIVVRPCVVAIHWSRYTKLVFWQTWGRFQCPLCRHDWLDWHKKYDMHRWICVVYIM